MLTGYIRLPYVPLSEQADKRLLNNYAQSFTSHFNFKDARRRNIVDKFVIC
jgi:hypothetical protein